MTPAEWLAWIILGWAVVATVWKVFDNPIERKINSYFYLVATMGVEVAAYLLALTILGAAAWLFVLVAVVGVLGLIGAVYMAANGQRTL
jgi:hypothetical protein